jgi:hypothetical protein
MARLLADRLQQVHEVRRGWALEWVATSWEAKSGTCIIFSTWLQQHLAAMVEHV